ncbi:hypothetical protein KPY62_07635 [Psychrobacter sp. TAE2020]|nr:hypothetical protein [Psychrobacter sp. TAE2020]
MNLFMNKALVPAAAIIALMSISSVQASPNSSTTNKTDTPIHFNKGQVSTIITGKLKPDQNEHWYQFSATSWQYALINIAPLAGTPETANIGVLQMPSGKQDGTKGGIIYQGCLPTTGNYRLRIARNLMATQGKTAGYTVEVILLPKYASESLCK